MSSPSWDYIAKLVCIGDSGCGKSSLTIRLCEGRFVAHHDVTIGVEFGSRIVPVGPPHSKLEEASNETTVAQDISTDGPDNDSTASTAVSSNTKSTTKTNSKTKPKQPEGLPTPRQKSPPPVPQKHMKLSLWDTAGQETYKSVTRSYFRGASGALLVFDLSRRSTFLHVTDWLSDLRQIAEPDIVVVLVGNKADLTTLSATGEGEGEGEEEGDEGQRKGETGQHATTRDGAAAAAASTAPSTAKPTENKRQVTKKEAQEWAARNGVLEYVETSAKSGEGVERAFMRVAERIHQNIQAGKYDLNDRRSGVKGQSAAGGGAAAAAAAARAIQLDQNKKAGSGCC